MSWKKKTEYSITKHKVGKEKTRQKQKRSKTLIKRVKKCYWQIVSFCKAHETGGWSIRERKPQEHER